MCTVLNIVYNTITLKSFNDNVVLQYVTHFTKHIIPGQCNITKYKRMSVCNFNIFTKDYLYNSELYTTVTNSP